MSLAQGWEEEVVRLLCVISKRVTKIIALFLPTD